MLGSSTVFTQQQWSGRIAGERLIRNKGQAGRPRKQLLMEWDPTWMDVSDIPQSAMEGLQGRRGVVWLVALERLQDTWRSGQSPLMGLERHAFRVLYHLYSKTAFPCSLRKTVKVTSCSIQYCPTACRLPWDQSSPGAFAGASAGVGGGD